MRGNEKKIALLYDHFTTAELSKSPQCENVRLIGVKILV